jgi:hypothetical protein
MTQSTEINKGVHQGYPLSPSLFNIEKWNTDDIKGIQIKRNKQVKTLLFLRMIGHNSRV